MADRIRCTDFSCHSDNLHLDRMAGPEPGVLSQGWQAGFGRRVGELPGMAHYTCLACGLPGSVERDRWRADRGD